MKSDQQSSKISIGKISSLKPGLNRVTVDGVELVAVSHQDEISVFTGYCMHEGALLSQGFIDGDFLTCGKHLWRYHLLTGELDKEPGIYLKKLDLTVIDDEMFVKHSDIEEVREEGEEDW